MIEKEIFDMLQSSFGLNAMLQRLKVFTFMPKEEIKPLLVYEVKDVGVDTATISLHLESNYMGLAEATDLAKEIKDCLENQQHIQEGYAYVFKRQENLTFKVKRFQLGEE